MALHLIPVDGAPHVPTAECGCVPWRIESLWLPPDGPFGDHRGAKYVHRLLIADDERQEGLDHAAAGP